MNAGLQLQGPHLQCPWLVSEFCTPMPGSSGSFTSASLRLSPLACYLEVLMQGSPKDGPIENSLPEASCGSSAVWVLTLCSGLWCRGQSQSPGDWGVRTSYQAHTQGADREALVAPPHPCPGEPSKLREMEGPSGLSCHSCRQIHGKFVSLAPPLSVHPPPRSSWEHEHITHGLSQDGVRKDQTVQMAS